MDNPIFPGAQPAPAAPLVPGAADVPSLAEMPAVTAAPLPTVDLPTEPTVAVAAGPAAVAVAAGPDTVVGPAPAATPAPAPVVAPDQVARFVSDKPRTRTVALEWPVLFEGVLYETVSVRRLSTKEVADFVASLKDDPNAEERRWPMCDVPDAVLDAIDDDDALAVDAAVADFLPRRFRPDRSSAAKKSA